MVCKQRPRILPLGKEKEMSGDKEKRGRNQREVSLLGASPNFTTFLPRPNFTYISSMPIIPKMNNKTIWISHPLALDTPAYGGGKGISIDIITEIANGDSANTLKFTIPNHLGTHIDAPRHFIDTGLTITSYTSEFWVFRNPLLVDVSCDDGYLIEPKDIFDDIPQETDLLLIRTGYEKYRSNSRYWQHNPGLHPDLAALLRKRFSNLRAIGMDTISVSSQHHREKGRASHRLLLDPMGPGTPILPVEDMSLKHINGKLKWVIIAPLRLLEADGAPCTVIASLE